MYLRPAVCQTLLSVEQSSLIISRTQPDDAKIDPHLTYFWLVWTCLFSLLLADHVFLNTSFLNLFPWDSGRIPSGLSDLPYHPFRSVLWWESGGEGFSLLFCQYSGVEQLLASYCQPFSAFQSSQGSLI